MKTLTDLQVSTIRLSMLRNSKSEEEILQALEKKTKKLNEPKKTSSWDDFDEEDESGIMHR